MSADGRIWSDETRHEASSAAEAVPEGPHQRFRVVENVAENTLRARQNVFTFSEATQRGMETKAMTEVSTTIADTRPRSWPALRNGALFQMIPRVRSAPAIEFRDSGDRDDRYFEWLARLPEAERARRGLGE